MKPGMKRLISRIAPCAPPVFATALLQAAEPQGYLAATQTRDGDIQRISSKNHCVFNLAWLKQLPPAPRQ